MKLPIKKGWAVAICIFLLLTILNPTRRDFIEFLGKSSTDNGDDLSRKMNFFVFSIYYYDDHDGGTYLAILKNFIKIKDE